MKNRLKMIHETALRILKEIGVKLYHPEILDLVQQKGVRVAGQTAFFEPDLVMRWVGRLRKHLLCMPETPGTICTSAAATWSAPQGMDVRRSLKQAE